MNEQHVNDLIGEHTGETCPECDAELWVNKKGDKWCENCLWANTKERQDWLNSD